MYPQKQEQENQKQEQEQEQKQKQEQKKLFSFKNRGKRPARKIGQESSFTNYCQEGKLQQKYMGLHPYCAIGRIVGDLYGTGFLIGPSLVMTSAHNLVGSTTQNLAFEVYDRQLKGLKKYKIKDKYFPEEYKTATNDKIRNEYDYAFLFLEQDLNQSNGYLGYSTSFERENITMKGTCLIAGFQGADKFMKLAKNTERSEIKFHNSFLSYKLSSDLGQSGSPVFIKEDDEYFAIGIHIQGKDNQIAPGSNLARRINLEVIERLQFRDFISLYYIREQMNKRELNQQQFETEIKNYEKSPFRLVSLAAESNKISCIPKLLLNYINLVSLNLRDNKITGIPSEIKKLEKLSILDLSDNLIETLPEGMKGMGLKQLNISKNNLIQYNQTGQLSRGIPWPVLESLNKLEKLYLNGLKIQQVEKLPKSLSELYLTDNQIQQLGENMENLKQLTILDASNNPIKQFNNSLSSLEKITIILKGRGRKESNEERQQRIQELKSSQFYNEAIQSYYHTYIFE